jgi:serine phosphatase RsbU (regulator of sigma subunit)
MQVTPGSVASGQSVTADSAAYVIDQATPERDERLHRILAVTDAALSHLDTEALLRELLERVRALLDTDTAAFLILDQDSQQLATVAAVGLDDEVAQGFRVDVGAGFAGRVASMRAPVVIDQVNESNVNSPALRRTGLTTLVGVPMLAGGDVVGVMHLGTYERRQFSEQEIALLQLVADRAGLASRARQSQTDRDATLALQRSLLPGRLPHLDGVNLAARYLPGHNSGVGGDWYDVFHLPSGHLGVVVGDVTGHGLRAAVVMGRLKSALRSYALEWDDPAEVLTRLDRKITHFESGSLATVLYAIISPSREQLRITTAGHPPPVLATSGGDAQLLVLPPDAPVGAGWTTPRRTTTVEFPEGSTLVLYTDGLVERRHEVIDQGLRRLCRIIQPGPAEAVCLAVMAHMDVAVAADDIALLAINRERPKNHQAT